jgi:hypothetical protein
MEQEKRRLTDNEAEKIVGGANFPPGYEEILKMIEEAQKAQEEANREMNKKW